MRDPSRWHAEIRRRLVSLSLRPEDEAGIVEELAEHLEEDYQCALSRGVPEPQAWQEVLAGLSDSATLARELKPLRPAAPRHPIVPGRKYGNPVAELWQDLRYGLRTFRRQPGFTALAVLSLALGIGGNAAMFSILSTVLIRPLPYPEPHRLVRAANSGFYPLGGLVALQRQSRTMDVAGFRPSVDLNLTGQGEAWRLTGSAVSGNLFPVLGAQPALGRAFREGDDQPGKDNLVILAHSLWHDRFHADPGIVGRVVRLGDVDRQVVGVMPTDFAFPDATARFWIPLHLDSRDQDAYWAQIFIPVMARLRPGVTLQQAQSELQSLSRQMIALYPYPMGRDFNAKSTLVPLQEFLTANVRSRLIVLQCAIGLVLLIACVNVANLMLARAASRRKEIAIRTALGAQRDRIVRQLLTECLLLALLGGATGVALAGWGVSALSTALPPGFGGANGFPMGWPVFWFAAALSILAGLLSGLVPAFQLRNDDLAGTIRTGGQRSAGVVRARVRSSLIVSEVALAVVLSVGAGLLIRTLWSLARVNPGFQPQHVVTLRVSPESSLCRERSRCIALYEELLRRVQQIPGVQQVAAANAIPLSNFIPTIPVAVEGVPYVPSERTAPLFWSGAVTPDYFKLMGIPILEGRSLVPADGDHSGPVIVVSAATAKRYWPGQNPIGKHIRLVFEQNWRTVVGVAGDVRQYDLTDRAPDFIAGALYMPYRQALDANRTLPAALTLMVRTTVEPGDVSNRIRQMVSGLNPNVPVGEVRTLDSLVESSTQQSRSLAWLFAAFAAIALLLAAIGTYGMVSWSASQRTSEIGLRVALGATRGSVFQLVLGQSVRLVAAGLVIGVGASLALARLLEAFLYATASWDAITLASVSALLAVVALLAGFFPARHAATIDPLVALRGE